MPEKRGIDHTVHCVRDLDAATARFETLGFTLTPRAVHPFGTGNALIQLQGNFIELLTVIEPEKIQSATAGSFSFGEFCQASLDRREGMAMLVFESGDAHADHRDFEQADLQTYPVFDFSRKARLPGGDEATVAFSLAFVTHAEMPQAAFFTCQQHAPEYFWNPEYQTHANGAQRIDEIVMVADQPPEWRTLFAGIQGADRVVAEDERLTVTTARGQVTVMTAEDYTARFPGELPPAASEGPVFAAMTVTLADADAWAATLESRGDTVGRSENAAAFVSARTAFGVTLEFRNA